MGLGNRCSNVLPMAPQATLRVAAIQRFCLHDGPGIRTTLFLQGCGLRCWWCHNPGMIADDAPAASGRAVGELADELSRDERFWRASGGGLTFSGGEPLRQADAVLALLAEAERRGWHRAIETAGAVPREAVSRVAPRVDLWLWDVKSVDAERFRAGTGGEVAVALDNLAWVLRETQTPVRIRVPLINSFNDDVDEWKRIGHWIAEQGRQVPVELLPGHDLVRGRAGGPPTRSARVSRSRLRQAEQVFAALEVRIERDQQ
jgi:pyruvate formate lyase activating enzyme